MRRRERDVPVSPRIARYRTCRFRVHNELVGLSSEVLQVFSPQIAPRPSVHPNLVKPVEVLRFMPPLLRGIPLLLGDEDTFRCRIFNRR